MIELTFVNSQPELGTDADGLTDDDTFKTAILISLLSDARAEPAEAQDITNLGGWWGDSFPDEDGDEIGSKLWLLGGMLTTDDTLTAAERYSKEALEWMVKDKIADGVEVIARRVSADVLDLEIQIDRPDLASDVWLGTWEATIESI